MAEHRPQSYQNHTRFDPVFHFFLIPITTLLLFAAVWNAWHNPGFVPLLLTLGNLMLLVAIFLIRVYSLKVQDRVIRLEERLRLRALLPESQRARIGELTVRQLIALRFASDEELPALAIRAIDERLAPGDIKKAIRNWRADEFRV